MTLSGACVSTTTSRPGSFLTDVRVVPTGLAYTTCEVEYGVTRSLTGSSKGVKATTAECGDELVKFPEDAFEVPPHCWATVEPWIATPASKEAERSASWAAIPPDCQALLAGGRS